MNRRQHAPPATSAKTPSPSRNHKPRRIREQADLQLRRLIQLSLHLWRFCPVDRLRVILRALPRLQIVDCQFHDWFVCSFACAPRGRRGNPCNCTVLLDIFEINTALDLPGCCRCQYRSRSLRHRSRPRTSIHCSHRSGEKISCSYRPNRAIHV